jgi:predicted DNA-binding transcriptional regulator YafY
MSAEQLQRIVSLVAELSREASESDPGRRLAELGARFGVSSREIARDIRTLTLLGDQAEADWLLSLRAWQQGDRVWLSSRGPFRRPILLSPDERLALQVALALDREGAALAARLGTDAERPAGGATVGAAGAAADELHWLVVRAVEQRRRLEIVYAGEGDAAGRRFTVEPHELVGYHGRSYLHAWDEGAGDWRLFRLDRFLEAATLDGSFAERDDFRPVTGAGDLFRAPPAALERVRVRFSARAARRARERYPECDDAGDGAVVVTFLASSVDWLVRRVLEYGADAEVLEPPAFREAMRRAVS